MVCPGSQCQIRPNPMTCLFYIVCMMCKIKKQENKYYIKKVVSEECGSYAFLRQHSFPAGACSTISKLWFEEVDTCGSSKNLLLPERGKAQTVSLWIFFGHIFVCTGVLKNDLVVLDACKKLHLLGREVPWAPGKSIHYLTGAAVSAQRLYYLQTSNFKWRITWEISLVTSDFYL